MKVLLKCWTVRRIAVASASLIATAAAILSLPAAARPVNGPEDISARVATVRDALRHSRDDERSEAPARVLQWGNWPNWNNWNNWPNWPNWGNWNNY